MLIHEGIKKKNLIFFIIDGQFDLSNPGRECEIYGEEAMNIESRESEYDFSLQFKNEGKIAFMTIEKI